MSTVINDLLETLVDNRGDEYLAFNVSGIEFAVARPLNTSQALVNYCSFQSETLAVSRQAAGAFSTELTDRDDLILAILSLLLLFVIEGILTAILLRTYHGNVSNFGFSIRQFIELIRDFRLRALIRGRRGNNNNTKPVAKSKINFRLLILATVIVLFTSVLEGTVLFLSTPGLTNVTNAKAAFTLIEVVNPDWNQIRDHVGAATVKPCTSIILQGVDQGNTRVNPCLTASGDTSILEDKDNVFTEADSNVTMAIVSDMHEFGADHEITIGDVTGNSSAKYIARAYFSLGDRRRKLLRKRSLYYTWEASVKFLHRQYVAFLFNHYVRKTNDTRMNFERLKKLEFTFETDTGPLINISQVSARQRFREAASQRHKTTVTGILPRGPEAFRLGTAVLKASTGIAVEGPDLNDYDMGSGSTWAREALMWREESRSLNWLSLTVVLCCALLIYGALRYLLKPIGTAEIAGAFVANAVGADIERGPAFLGADERKTFSVSFLSGTSSERSVPSLSGSEDGKIRRSNSYTSEVGIAKVG